MWVKGVVVAGKLKPRVFNDKLAEEFKGVVVAGKLKPGFLMANYRRSTNHSTEYYFPMNKNISS